MLPEQMHESCHTAISKRKSTALHIHYKVLYLIKSIVPSRDSVTDLLNRKGYIYRIHYARISSSVYV